MRGKKCRKLIACGMAVVVISLVGCGSSSNTSSSSSITVAESATTTSTTESTSEIVENESDENTSPEDAIVLTVWASNELHKAMFDFGEQAYNKEHPNEPIDVRVEVYANAEMAEKLLIALQSGTGAPDIADININYFSNYCGEDTQLIPLDDIVKPVLDSAVQSRFDIYKFNDHYYGIPAHVGSMFTYYNMDIIERAGYTIDDVDQIETWDQYYDIGAGVLEKTGIPMTAYEVTNQRPFWPMIVSAGGDYLDADGNVTLDSQINIDILNYMLDKYNKGIAVQAAGGSTAVEEFWTAMNAGQYASLSMPSWYMSRFINYMPDLDGKIAVRLMPVMKEGDAHVVGIGGTGTAITNQCQNIEIAKEFLTDAKLTYEANVNIWESLMFDPVRTDTWTDDALTAPSSYFYNESPFTLLSNYVSGGGTIPSPNNKSLSAAAQDVVNNTVMYEVFVDGVDPKDSLQNAADELRGQ